MSDLERTEESPSEPLPTPAQVLVAWLQRVFGWMLPARLETSPPPAPLSSLYILNVDFVVSVEKADQLDKALEPLRKKYGIDVLLLEKGMKLEKFDEIGEGWKHARR